MRAVTIHIVLFFCFLQMAYSQDTDGVVAFDIPARNSLMFNRFVIHPTFSFVREQNKYITVTNKRELVEIEDAPLTYFFNYSGRIKENIGAGIGVYQQNYGVLTSFGGIVNFAYNVRLQKESNLTLGLNVGAYKSGLDSGKVITNFDDPALDNIPSNFLLTINPGINYGSGFIDFGVSLNNIVTYNFNSSALIDENTKRGIQGHMMYTGYFDGYGFFGDSKFSALAKSEFQKDANILSGAVMLTVPKGIWAQVGYNSMYGASGGIGLNITPQIAVEYNYEKPIVGLTNLGSAHEITLAYRFKNNNYFDYSRDDELAGLFSPEKKRKKKKKAVAKTIAKPNAQEQTKLALEEQTRLAKEEEARREAEAQAQAKLDAEAQTRLALEEQTRLAKEEEARREAEAQAQAKLDAQEQARLALEEQTRLAKEEEARREAEAQAQAKLDAQEQARLALEEQTRLAKEEEARREAEAQAQAKLDAEVQARLALEEQTRLAKEEQARREAEAQAQAKLDAEAQARLALEEQTRLAKEEEARREAEAQALLVAEEELKDNLIINPVDKIGIAISELASQSEVDKMTQTRLLGKLEAAVAVKDQDLKDLKKENDLSEQDIYVAPRPFKSISEENNAIEILKIDLDTVIIRQKKKIAQLESLLNDRVKVMNDLNDETNLYYLNTIAKLKSEQEKTIRSRESLVSTLKQISIATDFERKRRIKRAAYNNDQDRYAQDRVALNALKQNVSLSETPLTVEDFDFGKERSNNIQILKNVENTVNGYYLVLAVHTDIDKRDKFLTQVISSGYNEVDFFFDVNTSEYYIYSKKYGSISEAQYAISTEPNKVYNEKITIIKIED